MSQADPSTAAHGARHVSSHGPSTRAGDGHAASAAQFAERLRAAREADIWAQDGAEGRTTSAPGREALLRAGLDTPGGSAEGGSDGDGASPELQLDPMHRNPAFEAGFAGYTPGQQAFMTLHMPGANAASGSTPTMSLERFEQLAEGLVTTVQMARRTVANKWNLRLVMSPSVLKDTALELARDGGRLTVRIVTSSLDSYRLAAPQVDQLRERLERRCEGFVEVSLHWKPAAPSQHEV